MVASTSQVCSASPHAACAAAFAVRAVWRCLPPQCHASISTFYSNEVIGQAA